MIAGSHLYIFLIKVAKSISMNTRILLEYFIERFGSGKSSTVIVSLKHYTHFLLNILNKFMKKYRCFWMNTSKNHLKTTCLCNIVIILLCHTKKIAKLPRLYYRIVVKRPRPRSQRHLLMKLWTMFFKERTPLI